MVLLLFVCLFLYKLASNKPGMNWAPTQFSFNDVYCECTHKTKGAFKGAMGAIWPFSTFHILMEPV